jgi:hypothetical protein
MTSTLLDTLDDELSEPRPTVIVQQVFEDLVDVSTVLAPPRTKSLSQAKSLLEFYELVGQAIDNYESRAGTSSDNRVIFTEEEPDTGAGTETITFSVARREPGAFAQGAPMKGAHKNLRPIFRETLDDPNNPGYRITTLGYWYDNIVRFTCWARTNKVANARAEWFEALMEEYSWWFKLQGVDRVLFHGRNTDIVATVSGNKWYGRPLDYFVRTEKVRAFREKTIEEILVKYKVQT